MKRLIVSGIVAVLLLATFLPCVALAAGTPSASSSGTFTIGHSAPVINSVKLYNSAGTTEITTSMTPQTQYMFKVDVTHVNTLAALTQLRVIAFYYDGTPTWPDPAVILAENAASGQPVVSVADASTFVVGHNVLIKTATTSEFRVVLSKNTTITPNTITLTANLTNSYTTANNATITDVNDSPVTANSKICARFNWDSSTNAWTPYLSPDPLDTGTTTWSVGDFTEPTDFTANNFVFTGQFTPGKVATAGIWYIRARVTDTQNYDARGNTSSITMNTYDEIDVTTGSVDWGGLTLDATNGVRFTDSPNPLTINVKYIANGNYSKYVSSSNWSGSSHTATLNNTGTPAAANQFSLKAVIGGNTGYLRAVDGSYSYGTLIDATGTQSYEIGDTPASTMALALYKSFDPDTYQGTMVYYIVTR